MVCYLYYVKIVLDDYYRIAFVHELIQNSDKPLYVVCMKSRSWLVQNIYGFSRAALGKFGSQLHPLRLAARKRGGGLTQLYIAQAHLLQSAYLVVYLRHVPEEVASLVHRHFKNVVNALSLVFHFQRFAVVAFAAAHFAGHIDVREKVHFYLYNAVAAAVFAPAARYVEGKSSRVIAARLCVGQFGEQLPYRREYARIRGGVGARSSAYRALVNGYHLIQIFYARDVLALHVDRARAVELCGERGLKNFAHERAFSAARNARYGNEFA